MKRDAHRPPTAGSGRAYVLLTFTTLCWGGNAVFARLAVGEVSPIALVSLRVLGPLLLLAVIANRYVRRDWPVLRRHLIAVAAMGAVGFTAFNSLLYSAAHFTTAVNIGIIQGAIPVFIVIGVFAAYRSRITALQVAGVALTVCGVVIVATSGEPARLAALVVNSGDILMISACVLYAGFTVSLQKAPPVSALALFTVMTGGGFLASLPLVLGEAMLGHFQWPTAAGWAIVAGIALFPSFLAQITFIRGVALIGPGRAGIFVNLVPVFASVLAVVFLREPFEFYHGVALALVLGGIGLSERGRAA